MLLGVPIVPLPPRDPGTLARAILADTARYHLTQPQLRERPKNWLERAWDWVALQWSRLMGSLLGNLRVSAKTGSVLGAVLLFVLGATVLGAIARTLAALARGTVARAPVASSPRLPDARELYERSVEAAERKALTQALEILFSAAVASLAERGVTRYGSGATVGDLRRELRVRDPALVATFDAIAGPFTSAVYAQRPPGDADWKRAREAFLALWSERDAP